VNGVGLAAWLRLPEAEAMDVRVADEWEPDNWDDFVKLFPSSGPLHTRAWTESFKSERPTPVYLRLLTKEQPIVYAVLARAASPDSSWHAKAQSHCVSFSCSHFTRGRMPY
jgi:hypothetical protein